MQCYWVYNDFLGIWRITDKIPPYGIRYWFCDTGDEVYVVDNGLRLEGIVDSMDEYHICVRAGSQAYIEDYLVSSLQFVNMQDKPFEDFSFIPVKRFERYHDLTCPKGYISNGWEGLNNGYTGWPNSTSTNLIEPPCLCKYLLDGHDQNCQYIQWKIEKGIK